MTEKIIIGGGPQTQAEQAFRTLEAKIIKCELRPGAFLTEKEICAVTGFGRTPVREAILRLSYGMLVEVLPRQGIRIATIGYRETVMAIEVRILLERLIVERAIGNSGDLERRQFKRFAEEMRQIAARPDRDRNARIDDELNHFVADTARHEVATRHSIPLHTLTRRIGYLDTQHRGPGSLIKSAVCHAELCDALADGDVSRAHDALQKLYDLNIEILEALLESVLSVAAE